MKKWVIVLIAAVLLAVGGGGYYYLNRAADRPTAWAYVPDNALAVYETSQPLESWQQLIRSSLGAVLRTLPSVRSFDQQLSYLDSLPITHAFLQEKPLLTALHVVGNDALDATFFLSMSDKEGATKWPQVLEELNNDAHLRSEQRQYEGHTIYELSDQEERTFSYVLHQGVLAGSFTPFLVEDVVRNIADEFQVASFMTRNESLLNLPKLANDQGNLYLNARRLASLLEVFAEPNVAGLEALNALCRSALLDVNIREHQLLLNGFSEAKEPAATDEEAPEASEAPSFFLQTFDRQPARSVGMGDYIPNRTAWLYYLSFEEAGRWQQAFTDYQQRQSLPVYRDLVQRREAFAKQHTTSWSEWYAWMGHEVALLTLESIDVDEPDRALLIEVQDTTQARQTLRALTSSADTVPYAERFSTYVIGELTYPEFPTLLLGPLAQGYAQCFYLLTDRYLVMANSVRVLKRLILDHESENTWSKSLSQSRFLENTLNESNLSLVVDVARSWDLLLPRLSPHWRQLATEHATQFKQLERVAVQFSENEENFYTSVAINYPEQLESIADNASFATTARVVVDQPIRTKPYVVRNHNTQALEVLFQNRDNVLQLVSTEQGAPPQKPLWKDSLSGPIVSDVHQIDFYSNGKLQYLFASDSAVHLLDRNGNYVTGYPLYMPSGVQIKHLSLIDYDNSKQYRFLVSDTNGGLWMFNTDREILEGWNPNGVGSSPATPPFHVRVRSKDFLIAIGQNGTIYVKNRRGESYPGFPLQLGKACHSPAFVVPNSTPEETTLTTVTDDGELVTFNLLGNIVRREQLYRPSADAYFRLCEDALGKTFVLLRQDEASLGVLDRQGTLLFEKSFLSPGALASGMLEGQYYDFGAGNEVYAITDRIQEFTYLFDRQGALINERPVESDHAVGLLYSEDKQQFRLYRNFGNEFAILAF